MSTFDDVTASILCIVVIWAVIDYYVNRKKPVNNVVERYNCICDIKVHDLCCDGEKCINK